MGRERKIEMENLDDIFMFQLVANDAYECWRLVKANVARTWPACDPLQVPSFHCCQWPQLPNRKSKAEYSCLLFSSVLACNFHSYHKASVRPCIFTSYSTCRFDSINNKRSTLGADTAWRIGHFSLWFRQMARCCRSAASFFQTISVFFFNAKRRAGSIYFAVLV